MSENDPHYPENNFTPMPIVGPINTLLNMIPTEPTQDLDTTPNGMQTKKITNEQKNTIPYAQAFSKNKTDRTSIVRLDSSFTVNEVDEATRLFAAPQNIITGPGKLNGFLRKQAHREYLASPCMFPATVKACHLKRFHEACAEGSAKIVIMGDSIFSIGSNLISTAESPVFTLTDELMKQNPGVDIRVVNCAIGGQTWSGMWSDTSQPPPWFDNESKLNWKQFVIEENPDLLILYSGGNDGYEISVESFRNIIEYFQDKENYRNGKSPSIILGVTYQPSIYSSVNDYNKALVQDGITYALTYARNYAIAKGLGYLDFGRWHSMLRDGIDPCELSLTRVMPAMGTTLTAWSEVMPVNDENIWIFPECVNDTGVFSNHCTDWLLSFLVTANPEFIEIPLSAKNYTTKNKNSLYIRNSYGKIRISYQDGLNGGQFDETSDIDWPLGASTWMIVKKNGRVRVQIQEELNNEWNISGQTNINNGMGMVTVWDHEVVVFGAPYRPEIRFGVNVGLIVYNLCVGNSTLAQTSGNYSSGQRYRPVVSDYELYVASDNYAGGSNAFHMNAYGVRMVMAPVIRAQEWGRPVVGFLSANELHCSGKIIGHQMSISSDSYLNGVGIGITSFDKLGPYIVNDGSNGLQILVNSGDEALSGKVEICGIIKKGNDLKKKVIGIFDVETGNFMVSGQIGANGIFPSNQPIIKGKKPSDEIVMQILDALVANGFVKNETSIS
ncbi:hypothetical protein Amal_03106 [Acetobacter malorum]|uniref:SGNH hydrolase-type esterase domain-containing protein n=1 Tax=Acetobacter malorum TaxID=178901 RepID=A0A177G7D6_9PROT|nr:SGNH/GDSL hydrolase family protein [Acetobacter malorum]OAG75711.1 hypothetical protein Amal_03106 [Acetobacter malorum]